MGVTHLPAGELRPRLLRNPDPRLVGERQRIAARSLGGAREVFAYLRPFVLEARPVTVVDEGTPRARIVFGRSTFRNVRGL